MCVRETSISCCPHVPNWGASPQPKPCALTRNRTSNLSLRGTMPNQLSYTGSGQDGKFCVTCISLQFFFKILFIYLFLERGERSKRNINVCFPLKHPLLGTRPTTQACAPTGNQTGDPLVCTSALSPLSHTSQGSLLFFLKQIF